MVVNIVLYLHFFKFSKKNPTVTQKAFILQQEKCIISSYSLNILDQIIFIIAVYPRELQSCQTTERQSYLPQINKQLDGNKPSGRLGNN